MPLNKSLFEKNIAGNAAAGGGAPPPPRRKWGKPKATPPDGASKSAPSSRATSPTPPASTTAGKPKWGGSHLRRTNTVDTTTSSTSSSKPKSVSPLRRTVTTDSTNTSPAKPRWGGSHLKKSGTVEKKETTGSTANSYSLKKTAAKEKKEETVATPKVQLKKVEKPKTVEKKEEPTPVVVEEKEEPPTKETTDVSSTVTDATEDLTEKMEASGETIKEEAGDSQTSNNNNDAAASEEPPHDWAANSTSNVTAKKDKKSKRKDKKNPNGSIFALDERDYLKEVPPEKRTKGTFDWSGVDDVIRAVILDRKIEKKRDKLIEKLDDVNATREEALKMMKDHVEEQKQKLDESKEKVRRKMYEATQGMTYTEMVEKVQANNDIVTTLKKSNNKLRLDTQKMVVQVKNLRVNNMKLEAANEQSEKVLTQLKERKKAVDARYEHLTKVIIPPYQERIKEMEEVVEERKLYGRNEHRTKVRYGNYIIRFLDKVDRSDQSDRFKSVIWEMGQHVEAGDLADDDDSSDSDDDIQIEEIPVPPVLNESLSISGAGKDDKGGDSDSSDSDDDKEDDKKTNGKKEDDKSLWEKHGSGGNASKSGGMDSSSNSRKGAPSGKHADLLQAANRAKAKNFNGAVILSDSSDSDSDSESDDDSVSSDDS